MTVHDALVWCSQQVGQALDFDGQYGAQCFDFFNFYYQHVTGRNPYSDGAGVPNAYQIYDIDFPGWTRVANNMADPNQLPPPGSVIIYDGGLPGSEGAGHVAIVDYNTDAKNVHVYDQNWGGQYVHWQYHMWTGHERGWLIYNGFADVAPPPPPPAPDPSPAPPVAPPETPPTPVEPTPEPAGQGTVLPDLTNNVPTPPTTDGVVTVTVNPTPPAVSTTTVSKPAPHTASLTGWVWALLAAAVAAFLLFVH